MPRIGFLVYPGFQVIALAAASAFEVANIQSTDAGYEVAIVSVAGGLVEGSAGMAVRTQLIAKTPCDTLIVCGGMDIPSASPGLKRALRSASGKTRRIAAICTGAFLLADAGLLDGRRATTHWFFVPQMRRMYPGVTIDEDKIYVRDGQIWTSAGMTAGIDLALGLIEQDCGRDVARAVSRQLVLYHRRAGGQSQHSTLLQLDPKSDRVQSALSFAETNLRKPLSIEMLAAVSNLSPRQFSRVFRAETGLSPAKAIERLRVERARILLEQGRHSTESVAREVGFEDRNRMRRAFLRTLGQPPHVIRREAS